MVTHIHGSHRPCCQNRCTWASQGPGAVMGASSCTTLWEQGSRCVARTRCVCDEDEVKCEEDSCARAGFYKEAKRWDLGPAVWGRSHSGRNPVNLGSCRYADRSRRRGPRKLEEESKDCRCVGGGVPLCRPGLRSKIVDSSVPVSFLRLIFALSSSCCFLTSALFFVFWCLCRTVPRCVSPNRPSHANPIDSRDRPRRSWLVGRAEWRRLSPLLLR